MSTVTTEQISTTDIARHLNDTGLPPDFGPEISRLQIRVWRELAKGKPITNAQADRLIAEAGVDEADGREFLRNTTERDANDNIVGSVGLSLNQHPHRFYFNGQALTTWCAWDALFLPPALGQAAVIESTSAVSDEAIRIEVSPEGVERVSPEDAAVTIVLLDPEKDTVSTLEQIYSLFCHNVLYFASREEGERWAEDKPWRVAVVSVAEAYEVGTKAFASLLAHA